MYIEQIYTGCLAQGAYYITSGKEAAIIDPLREIKPYIERAAKDGVTIKYIFETHFHADFVSGHVDLARSTGATIVFGPTTMKMGYDAHIAYDGETFAIGDIKIKLLHTPGHTMESSCYLLIDKDGRETALFTGDTLFIGDVGRPDLAQKVIESLTQEKLASHLFDSLRNKIMPLADDIIVYPAHGAGSACGKNMSKETTDTLGNQKRTNYALNRALSREEFVEQVLTGLNKAPAYFPQNVLLNINGYDAIHNVMERGTQPLQVEQFEIVANETGAIILDTRQEQVFAQGFIPNSINIGIDGSFAVWVGTLIPNVNQEILIVAEPSRVEEVILRLARVGYDHCLGYLQGGFEAWKKAGKEVDTITSISATQLAAIKGTSIIDVRKESEYNSEHVKGTVNVPLDYINENIALVPKDKTVYIHCAGGYRSMIFTSILRARGYENLVDVAGGFKDLKASGLFSVTDYICPTTLL